METGSSSDESVFPTDKPPSSIDDNRTLITDWAADYYVDTVTSEDPRRSGSHPVWTNRKTVEVEILSPNVNKTGYAFSPSDIDGSGKPFLMT